METWSAETGEAAGGKTGRFSSNLALAEEEEECVILWGPAMLNDFSFGGSAEVLPLSG